MERTREAIYRMLSGKGNPEFRSMQKMLRAVDLRFQVDVREKKMQSPQSTPGELVSV